MSAANRLNPKEIAFHTALAILLSTVAILLGWFVFGGEAVRYPVPDPERLERVKEGGGRWLLEGWLALGAFVSFLITGFATKRGRVVEVVSGVLCAAALVAYPFIGHLSGHSFLVYTGLTLAFLFVSLHAGGFIASEIAGFAHDGFIERPIRIAGISAIVFVFGIFYFLFTAGYPLLFREDSSFSLGKFFTSTEWYPTSMENKRYGILALILGTLSVTVLAMVIAVPLAMGATVFLSEFCHGKVKETLKIVIELLAAIPSIVWGFIGLTVINPLIMSWFNQPTGLNVLNASIILALMSMPIMVSIGEDALKAVPDHFREAATALGATRWQMIYRVLLPAAKNGLLAAVLLGVGRAVGETMAVLMATGHSINIPTSVFDSCRTLTATIASELGEAGAGSPHYQVLFIIGILLLTFTFVINLVADLVVKGVRKQ